MLQLVDNGLHVKSKHPGDLTMARFSMTSPFFADRQYNRARTTLFLLIFLSPE